MTNNIYNESSNDFNTNDNNNVLKNLNDINRKRKNSKSSKTKSLEENTDNQTKKIKNIFNINKDKITDMKRKNTPYRKNKNNILSSNFSEMCTGNQILISQENREAKSNKSTEVINYNKNKKGNLLKVPEIHKTNNNKSDFETISDNFLDSKIRPTGEDYDEEELEDHIVMKNKIMYKLDEVDKNLEQTYEEK